MPEPGHDRPCRCGSSQLYGSGRLRHRQAEQQADQQADDQPDDAADELARGQVT